MELSKKSELTLGSASYVISTELAGDQSQCIRTQVLGTDGSIQTMGSAINSSRVGGPTRSSTRMTW